MTKKNTVFLLLVAFIATLSLTSYRNGASSHGNGDLSSQGCSCHGPNNTNTRIVSHVIHNVSQGQSTPYGQYNPGDTFAVSVIASSQSSTFSHFGFQTTVRSSAGNNAGVLSSMTYDLQTYSANGLTGIEHAMPIPKIASGNFYQATFQWIAPPAGPGPVTFFTAVNVVDNDSTTSGDQPNVGSRVLQENTSMSVDAKSTAHTINVYPNPAKEQIHIDAAGWKNGTYTISVTNIAGGAIMQKRVEVDASHPMIDILLPDAPTGLYVLRVHGNSATQAAPLFIH